MYNGNIAETFWRTATDGGFVRNYGYKYDNLNRLKEANYQKSGQLTNMYNENLTYDKNGNIMNLSRYGDRDEQYLPIQIDNLQYGYATNSNKLMSVVDNSNNTSGFKDGITTGDDYAYDANGNITVDKNKNITAITYNHLNLPTKIIFPTGNIVYIYTASGQKMQKIVTDGTNTTTTDYLGGYQYQNTVLQFFSTVEGYVKNTANVFSYVYNYTDHLGNVRLSYTKNPSTNALTILDENNYYPFGLKHSPYNAIAPAQEYKYKFQGQERQDELGLNWDSFKWRNYDYAIGRFMSIDPLAEKYSYQSSYNFSENRVIDARELEGLEAFIIHGTTQTKTGHTFSNSALNQLQRIGGNTVRNESFRWNAPLFNNDSFDRALAAKELASYVVNKRASLIKSGKISDSEPITLVGYSHGGNVGIQAADIIYDVTGLKVNLLTVSTPAYKTDKSLVGSGLAGLEDPNKKTSINSHIQVVHKNDDVVNLALGNETYNTNNSAHPVKNYVIPEKEVNLSGGIESHTKLPSNSNFAEYLKKIPQMDNPNK